MPSYIPRPTPLPIGRTVRTYYSLKEVFEALLFEVNKVKTAIIDVEMFNHLFTTANQNYYNKRYSTFFDINQQSSDDFRHISATVVLTAATTPALDVGGEKFNLRDDYFHTTSVVVFWKVLQAFKNYKLNSIFERPAERTTPGELSKQLPDFYARASYLKPEYLMRDGYVELVAGLHARVQLTQVAHSFLLLPEKALLYTTDLDDPTQDPSYVLKQPAAVTAEVLKIMTALVLENFGDPRTPGKVAIDQALPQQAPQQQAGPPPRR